MTSSYRRERGILRSKLDTFMCFHIRKAISLYLNVNFKKQAGDKIMSRKKHNSSSNCLNEQPELVATPFSIDIYPF